MRSLQFEIGCGGEGRLASGVWCRRRESNPYATHVATDFESVASASSATAALFVFNGLAGSSSPRPADCTRFCTRFPVQTLADLRQARRLSQNVRVREGA